MDASVHALAPDASACVRGIDESAGWKHARCLSEHLVHGVLREVASHSESM
jgi:hypothetical protein